MKTSDLNNRFDYHRPDTTKVATHEAVREIVKRAAIELAELVPPGQEEALVFTKLEEAMFWANAAVARN